MPDPLAAHKDALVTFTARAVQPSASRDDVKRVLLVAWKMLPLDDRQSFLRKLDPEGNLMQFRERWPSLNDPLLEEAARWWPYVVAAGSDDEPGFFGPLSERMGDRWGFSKRVMSDLRRSGWKPSDKQARFMKDIYVEFRRWWRLTNGSAE